MPQRFANVTGFVLAGGESRRMRQPKAFLMLEGRMALDRQVHVLRAVCRTVAVLGSPENRERPDAPFFPDEFAGRGPLAALYTGLLHTRTEYNLFLGCDLPFVSTRFLRYLCRRALVLGADVTVPESLERRFHPLAAVYRRRALWAVRASLLAGENKVSRFFSRVHSQVVAFSELARAGFGSRVFANMNTPEDYEDAKRQIEANQGCGF